MIDYVGTKGFRWIGVREETRYYNRVTTIGLISFGQYDGKVGRLDRLSAQHVDSKYVAKHDTACRGVFVRVSSARSAMDN